MNCSFEICSILITLIIIVYFGKSRRLRIYQNNVFFAVLILNMITALTEVVRTFIYQVQPSAVSAMYACSMVYFLAHFTVVPLLFVYMVSLARDWSEMRRLSKALVFIPYGLGIIFILLNPFTNLVFSYENGLYVRHEGMVFLYIIVAFFLVGAFGVLIAGRRLYSVEKRITMYLVYMLFIGALALQYMDNTFRVETFAIAFGNLIIMFMICNPMDMVDRETGLFNRAAFTLITTKHFLVKRYVDLICVTIMESEEDTYSDYGENSVNSQFTSFFKSIWNGVNVYRVEEQTYIMEFCDADDDIISRAIKSIEERFSKPWVFEERETIRNARILSLALPEDVDSLDKIFAILKEMKESEKYIKPLTIKDFDAKRLERSKKINSALMRAFEKNSFEIAYTPIYSIEKSMIVGVEVSTKLVDSEIGVVDENDIVEFGEKTGLYFNIAENLFEKACDFICSETAMKGKVEFISVRLGSISSLKSGIITKYVEIAGKKKIDPSRVIFTLSEYTLSKATDILEETMNNVHEMGFRFCLDEYGSGYTNMESIYTLPFDNVKMSRNVTRDACLNEKAAISMEGVMNTFKSLSMENTVDGILDTKELKRLETLPCKYAMGQLFTERLDLQRLVALIAEINSERGGAADGC